MSAAREGKDAGRSEVAPDAPRHAGAVAPARNDAPKRTGPSELTGSPRDGRGSDDAKLPSSENDTSQGGASPRIPLTRFQTDGRKESGPATPSRASRRSEFDVRQALELVVLIVAPTTLVTALLYWTGFQFVQARSSYFGLGVGVLGFSTTDYLIRGVEAGIVPLIVLLLALLVAAIVQGVARDLAGRDQWPPGFWRAVWAVLGLSVALTAVAVYGVFRPLPILPSWYLLPPTLLAIAPLVALPISECEGSAVQQ